MVTKPQLYTKNKSLIDFSEIRLRSCIKKARGSKREALNVLLDDYINGIIAIYWKCGNPIGIKIVNGK